MFNANLSVAIHIYTNTVSYFHATQIIKRFAFFLTGIKRNFLTEGLSCSSD